MLVVHKKDLKPIASNHDPIENVEIYRLFTDKSLPKMPNGDMPYINWAEIPPGKFFSRHRHGDDSVGMTEFFVIIDGTGVFTSGEKKEVVVNGDMICVPKGEVHTLKNSSLNQPLVYLCFGVANGGKTVLV